MGHRLGPRIIAELAGVIAQVARECPPATRVGESAAEDAVGARHVRGMSKNRTDVGLGLLTRTEAHDSHRHARGHQDLANEVAGRELRLFGGRRRRCFLPPTANRDSRPSRS